MRVFLFFIMLCFSLSVNGQNKSLDKFIEKTVIANVNFKKTPGLVIGIIDLDSTYTYGMGELEKGKEGKPTADHIFELGSATKVFTASLLSRLVAEGKMDYEESVPAILGEAFDNLAYKDQPLLVKHLVSHTNGFPKLPLGFGRKEKNPNAPYAHYTKDDLLKFLDEYHFADPLGESYKYSHVNFALLEILIEKKLGQPFQEILDEYLLEPMDLKAVGIDLESDQLAALSPGYSISGNQMNPWTFQSFEGSMGYKSTLNEALNFLNHLLGNTDTDWAEQLAETQELVLKTDLPNISVAKGWHIYRPKKKFHNVMVHSGVTEGHRCYIAMVKEKGTAVVILSNSENSLQGLGNLIMRTINQNWKK